MGAARILTDALLHALIPPRIHMLTLPRPTVLLGSLLLLAYQPPVDQVQFHPADGFELAKTFTMSGSFELGDISMVVSGQDMSGMIPIEDASGSAEMTLSVVDHYVKTVDGKPIEFAREFVKSGAEWEMAEESGDQEDWIELDGETIVFKWNDETKSYDRSFKDGEGDQEKLDEMGINPELLDYRSLLPQNGVSAGDRWSVSPKGLGSALMFGLDFDDLPSMTDEIADPDAAAIFDQLKPSFEEMMDSFKTDCEYVGTRDEGGVNVGVIKVHVVADGAIDMAQIIEEMARKQIPPEVQVEMSLDTAAFTVKLNADGELLWNLEKGVPYSFELGGKVELAFELDASVSAEGQEQTIEANVEMMGDMRWTME